MREQYVVVLSLNTDEIESLDKRMLQHALDRAFPYAQMGTIEITDLRRRGDYSGPGTGSGGGVVAIASVTPASRETIKAELESTRDWLFDPLKQAERWTKAEIAHHPSCNRHKSVEWTVVGIDQDEAPITGSEWANEQRLTALSKLVQSRVARLEHASSSEVIVSSPQVHRAHCAGCGARARALSLRVVVANGDHRMMKEFAL